MAIGGEHQREKNEQRRSSPESPTKTRSEKLNHMNVFTAGSLAITDSAAPFTNEQIQCTYTTYMLYMQHNSIKWNIQLKSVVRCGDVTHLFSQYLIIPCKVCKQPFQLNNRKEPASAPSRVVPKR